MTLERDYMLSILNTCGLVVDSMLVWFGKVTRNIHRVFYMAFFLVYKRFSYTQVYSQTVYFLCADYKQVFSNFISVTTTFVHIMHIAYKKNYYLKKGTY
jgi:hypothetical protein